MNYLQYMKPGGNFENKLKTGIKKFLKAAGEASRMAKDARINNPGAAMIRDAYAKGDKELAKLLTDEMQTANLTGIALGSSTAPLITGFTMAPVTTGATLATGMAGGMAGMYGTDKAINYFSDGKYTGWGDWVNQATNGAIGQNTAGFFHPGAIFGGLITGKIGNKIVGVSNRGKLELLNSALNKNILATTLQPTVADEAVLRGQLGWAPKQTIHYRHGSFDPELKTFVPKHDRWDVVTHGADPNMYFVTDLSTPVSAANMMDLRPHQYTGSIVAEKPMVQVGDFNAAGKNATRNQLIARARQQGADTYLLQDVVDNKVPHLNIVARFIGPEGEAVQGGVALTHPTVSAPTHSTTTDFSYKGPLDLKQAINNARQSEALELLTNGRKDILATFINDLPEPIQHSSIPIPVKEHIETNVIPRLVQQRPWLDPDAVITDVQLNTKGPWYTASRKVFDAAGYEKIVQGVHTPRTGNVTIADDADDWISILIHELRHKIDAGVPLTLHEDDLLRAAFGDEFINIPYAKRNNYDTYLDMVTTIGDARKSLFGSGKGMSIEQLNFFIDLVPDNVIVNAVADSNGYGKELILLLQLNKALTPERVKAFREAMKYVGMSALPLLLSSIDTQNYKSGGKLNYLNYFT